MKKLFVTFLCAAALGLASCAEQSLSSAGLKANLESKGYTAEVMNKTEAEKRIKGVEYIIEITDAVYSSKGEHDVFLAFVCKSIADATKFVEKNIQAMVNFVEQYTEDNQVGSHNNVAYTGSRTLVGAAGIPLTQK